MKRFVLSTMFLLFVATGFTQENYFVTVVKGSVSKADGSAIKPGAKLSTADKVTMGNRESLLILLHPSKGRIVVSPQASSQPKDNKFVLLVKDFLNLNQNNVRLSSRTLDDAPLSLEDYFKTDPEINSSFLVIDTLKVRLPRSYTAVDNKENFFFLQLSGAKTQNHKLLCRNNILYITKDDISFNDGMYKKADGQLNLGYIENYSGNKKVRFITAVEPAFISRETGADAIRLIKKTLKGRPEKEIQEEVYTQMYYQYGKPDEQAIKEIYSSIK
ncbi:MAG: hypothetical protein ACKOU7_10250 [Ferruginibacter sp.]